MNQPSSLTIVKFSKLEYLLFFLTIFSIFLPAGAQSTVSFLLLFWWIRGKGWRVAKADTGESSWWRALRAYCPSWYTLVLGTAALGLFSFISVVGQRFVGPVDFSDFGNACQSLFRLIAKQGLYGCAMITAFILAEKRGWRFDAVRKPLVVLLVIYCFYMLLQRHFGFDWLHGFNAKIGPHRYADGIYRPAGFTSHPLSLAFAVMSPALMMAARAIYDKSQSIKARRLDSAIAVLLFGIIVLSATRWVMVVYMVTLAGIAMPVLKKHWGKVLGVIALAVIALLVEQNLLKRFLEPFMIEGDLAARFPRTVFWRVHWNLFTEWPLFGAGFPMNDATLTQHYIRYGYGAAAEKYNAHNMFLQQLANFGLAGLVGFLCYLAAQIKAARQLLPGWQRSAYFMVICAAILGCLMENSFRDHESLYSLWICLSIIISSSMRERDEAASLGSLP